MPISVLIVDDHAAFRARAREMLGSASNHVVARADAAANISTARRLCRGVIGRAL